VSEVSNVDQDVFGYFRQDDKVELAVLLARRGRVVGLRTFDLRDVRVPDDELIASFVGEYYGRSSYVPHELLLPLAIEAAAGLEQLLAEQRGGAVKVLWPQRGKKAHLLRMAQQNAAHAYREKARAREDIEGKLQQIQHKLALPRLPERIECVDISHIGGEHTVAVIVSFERGVPDKKRYRSYRVRDVASGDDYAAIHHVLTRRLTRVQRGDAGWEPPDLLLIDGGKGQLAMAERALQELGLEGLPIAALAKEKQNVLGEQLVDRVYLPGRKNAIELREGGSGLQILAYARDEAHRASNALRVKVGKKRGFESELDAIAGIGRKTRAVLLKAFGSVKAIAGASAEALVAAGATRKQADALAAHFRSGAEETEASEELAVEHAFADEPESEGDAMAGADAGAVVEIAEAVAVTEVAVTEVTEITQVTEVSETETALAVRTLS
jgi:excinuclease ABC subunit C